MPPVSSRPFPFALAWPRIDRTTLRQDAIAGLIGALLVIPQGVAFATLAGMPPEYGLYCAMVPTVIAAIFGSSWHAVTGPTNAVSLVVLATVTPLALPGSPEYIGLVLTLAFMTGSLLLAVGLLRLGAVANFVSNTVVIAFTAGAGLLIVATQLGHFFGIALRPGGSFFQILGRVADGMETINPFATLVAIVTVVMGLLSRRWLPRIPYLLMALVAGALAAAAINLATGPDNALAMLAPLPAHLPPLSRPQFSLESMQSLMAISLSLAVLTSTEAISIGRALALRAGQHYDASRELVGQGLANLSAAFFSGYPAAASFNRSAANYEAGARTPLSAIFSAVALAVAVLLLAPLAAFIPYAGLAGLLVLVASGLIDVPAMRRILATSRSEAVVLVLTLAGTLLLSLEIAILIGVIASLAVYLNRTSHPALRSLIPDPRTPERKMMEPEGRFPECPQLKLLRIEGSIYFGAVPHVERHFDELRQRPDMQKHLLIMSKSINFIDLAGADLLLSEVRARRELGGDVYFYSLRKPVEELLDRGGYLDIIGRDHVFRGKREAISMVYTRLDRELCRACTARVYMECPNYSRRETSTAPDQIAQRPT
jgi:sulfate permease, SulP family